MILTLVFKHLKSERQIFIYQRTNIKIQIHYLNFIIYPEIILLESSMQRLNKCEDFKILHMAREGCRNLSS